MKPWISAVLLPQSNTEVSLVCSHWLFQDIVSVTTFCKMHLCLPSQVTVPGQEKYVSLQYLEKPVPVTGGPAGTCLQPSALSSRQTPSD